MTRTASPDGAESHAQPRTPSTHFRLPPPPSPGLWTRLAPILRGLWAVVVLFATGIDALITAVIGIGPLTPRLRHLRQVIGDEYRAGRAGAIDAEVVGADHDIPDDPDDPDGPDDLEHDR